MYCGWHVFAANTRAEMFNRNHAMHSASSAISSSSYHGIGYCPNIPPQSLLPFALILTCGKCGCIGTCQNNEVIYVVCHNRKDPGRAVPSYIA